MSYELYRATSANDAIAKARDLGTQARFIAGGTDVIIQINRKRIAPNHLIDISGIADMSGITERGETLVIGALTTHKTLERHAFGPAFLAIAEAANKVGGHQVRNIATVGGNIANASPAADVVIPLLAVDAELALRGPEGARAVALAEFLKGPGKTARANDELIIEIAMLKPRGRSGSCFLKAGRRKAMEISVVCVAARVVLDDQGICRSASIALGAVGPTSLRASEAEAILTGSSLDDAVLREAGSLAAAASSPITDVRASAEYRRLLVEALVPRAIAQSVARAKGAAS